MGTVPKGSQHPHVPCCECVYPVPVQSWVPNALTERGSGDNWSKCMERAKCREDRCFCEVGVQSVCQTVQENRNYEGEDLEGQTESWAFTEVMGMH